MLRQPQCQVDVMQHTDHRVTSGLGPLFQVVNQLHLMLEIEMIGGFIEQDDLRLLSECTCEKDPLQLPAGKRIDLPFLQIGKPR